MNYLPNDITTSAPAMPSNRYVLPSFEERTPYGYKRQDPYAKLFEDRIIFLGTQVDDASADDIMAQLLVLEAQDPERDITLYINSPGGSFPATTAMFDTMPFIRPRPCAWARRHPLRRFCWLPVLPASVWHCRTLAC